MRYQRTFIAFLTACLLMLPAASFAADLQIEADSFVLSDETDAIPPSSSVDVEVTISNVSDEAAQADVVFYAGDEVFATKHVELGAGKQMIVSAEWLTPDQEQSLSLKAVLENQDPQDENNQNDSLVLYDVSLSAQAQQLMAQDEQTDESMVALDDTASQLTIHSEQMSWNTFRFRPSYRIGADDVELSWEFGDGERATGRVVTHTYTKPGSYLVQLTLKDQQSTETATTQMHIGFFHLSNWRLWVLLVLLGLIIIVAAIVAGVTDDLVSEKPLVKPKPEQPKETDHDTEETVLNTLTDETGELDSLAATGMSKQDFSDDLAFLEELEDETTSKPESAMPAVEDQAASVPEKVNVTLPEEAEQPAMTIPITQLSSGRKKKAGSAVKKKSAKPKKKTSSKSKKKPSKKSA